jgi:hypothetical protein
LAHDSAPAALPNSSAGGYVMTELAINSFGIQTELGYPPLFN